MEINFFDIISDTRGAEVEDIAHVSYALKAPVLDSFKCLGQEKIEVLLSDPVFISIVPLISENLFSRGIDAIATNGYDDLISEHFVALANNAVRSLASDFLSEEMDAISACNAKTIDFETWLSATADSRALKCMPQIDLEVETVFKGVDQLNCGRLVKIIQDSFMSAFTTFCRLIFSSSFTVSDILSAYSLTADDVIAFGKFSKMLMLQEHQAEDFDMVDSALWLKIVKLIFVGRLCRADCVISKDSVKSTSETEVGAKAMSLFG